MNIAIGSKTPGRNPRFFFGILTAALAAAAILIGVAVWQAAGAGSSATAVEPVAAPSAVPAVDITNRTITPAYLAGPTETNIYIVASEADKLALRDEVDSAAAVEGTGFVMPTVMVVETQEQQDAFNLMMYEQMPLSESLVNIVDLR